MLKTIKVNDKIKSSLMTPFPEDVLLTKPGSSNSTYVTGSTVTDKLNATFGFAGWEWEIISYWVENSIDKVITGKWENGKRINYSKENWIIEPQLPVCHVIGKLTVNFEREDGTIYSVSKTAPGAQPVVAGQSNQENCYKGAHTDALKKAATMFGIALELYRKTDAEHQYFSDINYENPWTPEELEKNKKEVEYVYSYIEKACLSQDEISELIENATGFADYDILPSNIDAVYTFLKNELGEEDDG